MKAKPSLVSGSVARLCLISAALLFAGAANAAVPIANKVVLDNGNTVALSTPAAAVDSKGNVHIVTTGNAPGQLDTCRSHSCNVYYELVSQSGTVLIRASQINSSGAGKHGHPRIAVTSNNKAVITWAGSGEKLRYAVVDPGQQGSLNGNVLQPAALVTPETIVGTTTGTGKHALVLNKNDIAYVLEAHSTSSTAPLDFVAFNPITGAVVHPQFSIPGVTTTRDTFPAMALDSAGNLHVVYGATNLDSDDPAGYLMLDGDGNKLIGSTQLFNSVPGQHPHVQKQHLFVAVDAGNIVHIVYGDKRNTPDAINWCNVCASGGTSVYVRLDPSKVPHNGAAANIATLRVGPEFEIPGFWYGRAFMGGDNLIHLIAGVGKTGSLAHIAFDPRTGGVAKQPVVHTGSTLNGADYGPKTIWGAGSHVVWAESVPDGSTFHLVMAPIASFY